MEPGTFWTAFLFAVIPSAILLGGIWWIDRYEKEPGRLLGLAVVAGAVIAPLVAWAIESGLDLTTSFSSQLIVPKSQLGVGTPLVEELVRGGVILLVFLIVRFEIDDVLDGLVYGGIVGVGFGAAANFVSIWSTPAIGHATASLTSAIVTGLNHVFYGALIGLSIAFARKGRTVAVAGAAVAGTALAFGFHVFHDYLPWWAASSAGDVSGGFGRELLTEAPNYLGVFILGVIALWVGGRQQVIVARFLRDEPADVVDPDEYAAVTNSLRRSWILWGDLLFRGDRVWHLRRDIYTTQVELAFRKFHRGEKELSQSRLYVDEDVYRNQIREFRKQLEVLDPAAARAKREVPPAGPRNALVAGLGSLATYLAVVAVFIVIWQLAFATDPKPTGPTVSDEDIASIASIAGAKSETPPPAPSPTEGGAAGATSAASAGRVNVVLCREIRLSRCIGIVRDGGTFPRQTPAFLVTLDWSNLKPGSILTATFISGDTRQPVADDVSIKVVKPTGFYGINFDGPFPRLNLVVALEFNGGRVDKVWQFKLA